MGTTVSVFVSSAFLVVLLTPFVICLAGRIGAMDHPGIRKVHEHPIARLGGLAIVLSSMTVLITTSFVNDLAEAPLGGVRRPLGAVLIAATFIFLIGLADDLRGLPARMKFLAEVTAAGALCWTGVHIDDIELADRLILHTGEWGSVLTMLWIVGVTNAVNISDGLDGLAAGVAAVACGAIAIVSFQGGDFFTAVFALSLLGSLAGFLVFNFHPAKVFMGDCGSLFLGFAIAACSVVCVARSRDPIGLALPALALGIPIFDTIFSMIRRSLDRRSLFAPDRSHFHHRLLDLGLSQRCAVLVIYLVTLMAVGFGLLMMVTEDLTALLVFGCVLLLLMLLFQAVGVVRLHESLMRLHHKCAVRRLEREDQRVFESLELRFRQMQDAQQWRQTIREAASGMDLAWVSFRTTRGGDDNEEHLWRSPKVEGSDEEVVTITLPFHNGDPTSPHEFEIGIQAHGSLETAGRRAMLFGRLLDEHGDVVATCGGAVQASHKQMG